MTPIFIAIYGFMIIFGITAIAALIWAIQTGQMEHFREGAASIFDGDEPTSREGHRRFSWNQTMSDAIATPAPRLTPDLLTRIQIDRPCRQTVVWYYAGAVFWLLAGSVLALVASLKMHAPSFLDNAAWLTFGRVRPAHLNTMIFGWASMAGIGTLLWLQARLSRVRLPYRLALPATAIIWNMTVAAGIISILAGYGTSTTAPNICIGSAR
jgi:hypothetical protein